MAKRSSVSVLAAEMPKAARMSQNESCSVDVRKIDNGFIVRESRCKGDEYTCSEHFTKVKPDLAAATREPAFAGSETMRGAKAELNRR